MNQDECGQLSPLAKVRPLESKSNTEIKRDESLTVCVSVCVIK